MEQKQLDEIDESYFVEEFIEEEIDSESSTLSPKSAASSPKKKTSVKKKAAKTKSVAEDSDVLENSKKEESEEITITPAKESVKKEPVTEVKNTEKKVETSSPVDPWADEEEAGSSIFKEASTWKAITGIVIVLLVVSVFTQGFSFSAESSATGAAVLSLEEAGEKAVSYVNTNLLQPPFTAELITSEEVDSLYKFTLDVAGQNVDSYMTKDGALFFPQGFEISTSLVKKENEASLGNSEEVAEEIPSQNTEDPKEETTPSVEKENPAVQPTGNTKEVMVDAKRWLFNPSKITVKKGDVVKLTIFPTDLSFTFAVPDFAVENEISGMTTVTFTADKQGSFEFLCSSCEEWRGMKGELMVE